MEKTILFELEANRRKLNFYSQRREKLGAAQTAVIDKWLEIYSERVKKLEKKATKLGLRTELGGETRAAKAN